MCHRIFRCCASDASSLRRSVRIDRGALDGVTKGDAVVQGGVLIGRVELTVGRDLQYIRFNGAMIGGLAGLALHALEQGLKLVT